MHQTRILLVDDHDIVRRGICSILSSVSEFNVICETSTGEEAVVKAHEHLPDIVLLDIGLPGISGLVGNPVEGERDSVVKANSIPL